MYFAKKIQYIFLVRSEPSTICLNHTGFTPKEKIRDKQEILWKNESKAFRPKCYVQSCRFGLILPTLCIFEKLEIFADALASLPDK